MPWRITTSGVMHGWIASDIDANLSQSGERSDTALLCAFVAARRLELVTKYAAVALVSRQWDNNLLPTCSILSSKAPQVLISPPSILQSLIHHPYRLYTISLCHHQDKIDHIYQNWTIPPNRGYEGHKGSVVARPILPSQSTQLAPESPPFDPSQCPFPFRNHHTEGAKQLASS